MEAKIKLKEHIKFRKEEGYILLCDLKHFKDYELPLRYYPPLLDLKRGIKRRKLSKELLKDLKNINAI